MKKEDWLRAGHFKGYIMLIMSITVVDQGE